MQSWCLWVRTSVLLRTGHAPESIAPLHRVRSCCRWKGLKIGYRVTGRKARGKNSDAVTQRSDELDSVVSNVESLIAQETPLTMPSRTAIREQISACLKELHAKLEEVRAIMEATSDATNMCRFTKLESELVLLKREIIELKKSLMDLNAARSGSDLDACMAKLDVVIFTRYPCFTPKEKQQLEELYGRFKDVTRNGDDGAVWLNRLIAALKEMKERKENRDAVKAIDCVVRETVTHVVDIYRMLFPSDDESEGGCILTGDNTIVQERLSDAEQAERDRFDDGQWKELSSRIQFRKPKTSDGDGGGGGGGGDDDDGDGSSGDDSDSGFGGWEIVTILLIYAFFLAFIAVIQHIFAEQLRKAELAKIPLEPESKKKRRKRKNA